MSGFSTFARSVRADHEAMVAGRAKYRTDGLSANTSGLVGDAVQKIGFQMMVAIRLMRLVRDSRMPIGARLISRAIRHVYGAEIHWDAQVADGVSIVHGTGLVISHGAVIGPGCVLFQGVTLGESIDPSSRVVGAPTLEADVHVGPGAVLIGPIVVGEGTKIMANVVLHQSVSSRSIVRAPTAVIQVRP